jgi:hypothetical protein
MKRVVKGNPDIRPQDIKSTDICVGRCGGNIYILTWTGHGNIFINPYTIGGIWSARVGDTVTSAIGYFDGEVFVLDSLSELADWIKDNS